jgi:hypothetical protein
MRKRMVERFSASHSKVQVLDEREEELNVRKSFIIPKMDKNHEAYPSVDLLLLVSAIGYVERTPNPLKPKTPR